ncbi:MAG TPA: long-chain-acyl-CoA synthetase [Steroidobacteraceae bacterium]|nr:long-chain-acyl-CoA synthetase [Steroidobacteraceae bacterium]
MNASGKAWLRALERTAPIEQHRSQTLPWVIDELAERFECAPALVSREASFSYRQLAARSNRYARWTLSQNLAPGEVVCLLLPNCPEYLAAWIGLNRVGVVAALINTHLSGETLAHAVNVASPRALIVAPSLAGALQGARTLIAPSVRCWSWGGDRETAGLELAGLERELAGLADDPLTSTECRSPALEDPALYIYTSGTTGLPKAALVSHLRLMQWSHWFAGLMDTQPSDRMYDCLPMYHSIGGVVAPGATLLGGGTVIVRERFSAQEFWSDVVTERCTLFQYIGELCRYLLQSPPQPQEQRHSLRLCCGNGLRAEVWEAFQSRFRVPQILEYYAATEGSFSLYNCEGRPGAIGRIPPFLNHRVSVVLIKVDPASGDPLRDADGRCTRCEPGEVGEAIGELQDATGRARGRFEGYADRQASQGKILRDVFAAGDAWFRSGDLMRQDAEGFFYFVDRAGDTFRWKGENVSTTEVAAVIATFPGVRDAVVYGVGIPAAEGRAGMAAIVIDQTVKLEALRSHLERRLPPYARPLFLRVVPALERTGSFRLKKHELAVQGYNPTTVSDPIYFDDRQGKSYVRLDAPLCEQICRGAVRL